MWIVEYFKYLVNSKTQESFISGFCINHKDRKVDEFNLCPACMRKLKQSVQQHVREMNVNGKAY